MIIRIFKATVRKELHEEFESKFIQVSVPLVKAYKGLTYMEIGRPSKWNPEEFLMITHWESIEHLIHFAGEQWNEPHIPPGMESYIADCSLDHFEQIKD